MAEAPATVKMKDYDVTMKMAALMIAGLSHKINEVIFQSDPALKNNDSTRWAQHAMKMEEALESLEVINEVLPQLRKLTQKKFEATLKKRQQKEKELI